MNFFHENGRGGIVDEPGKEAPAFVVDSSFRMTNLTNLHKYVKIQKWLLNLKHQRRRFLSKKVNRTTN